MEPSQNKQPDKKEISLIQILQIKQGPKKFKEDNNLQEDSIFSKNPLIQEDKFKNNKKSKKPQKWSQFDTNTFYKCLEYFGMDFEMISGVFNNKTQRQILRKYHKEKKQNPKQIEEALKKHESNLIEKNSQCKSFLNNILKQTSDSEVFSEISSDESLQQLIQKKLKLMTITSEGKDSNKDQQILPLEEYFKKFDIQ